MYEYRIRLWFKYKMICTNLWNLIVSHVHSFTLRRPLFLFWILVTTCFAWCSPLISFLSCYLLPGGLHNCKLGAKHSTSVGVMPWQTHMVCLCVCVCVWQCVCLFVAVYTVCPNPVTASSSIPFVCLTDPPTHQSSHVAACTVLWWF